MLVYIRCGKTSGTSAHSYLKTPNVNNNQWETRENGEGDGFICNKEILLTEELKLYLQYFCNTMSLKQMHTITSFSNIPLKQNVKVPGN